MSVNRSIKRADSKTAIRIISDKLNLKFFSPLVLFDFVNLKLVPENIFHSSAGLTNAMRERDFFIFFVLLAIFVFEKLI
ncbi:hypothetical protein D4R51_00940 [bacterium]|nr:MAG: hypothetical protein D4R51_00940 [bacterium]